MHQSAIVWLSMLTVVMTLGGCHREKKQTLDAKVELAFAPTPPQVGTSKVTLLLKDKSGNPLAGAKVNIEGNMNHAGMKPSFATLTEDAPGHYTGTLEFTMGGDWFVLVTAAMPDGRSIEHKIDVKGVRAR
jgi:YtkA-like